jgi:hypothetical protein
LQKAVALIIEGNSNQFNSEKKQMRENNENTLHEIQAAFALAIVLLNFLILAVAVGLIWSMQLLFSPKSPLAVAIGDTIWR